VSTPEKIGVVAVLLIIAAFGAYYSAGYFRSMRSRQPRKRP
jgi:hypothetical protein